MTTEIEEQFYKTFGIGKPVIKKWCYEGYYEDFSWQCSEENCTELLKYFDNSINKLNDRIQQMKKEKNTKFDRYTDSVNTEYGRLSGAYIIYPNITTKKLLELICILNSTNGIDCTAYESKNISDLKKEILNECMSISDDIELKTKIQQLFKEEE